MVSIINGRDLKDMLIGGISFLKDNENTINELNVFPVPDGDTGHNMLMTLEGGFKAISKLDSPNIGEVMSAFSKGALMGARGNSGVILSQILKGWQLGLEGVETANVMQLASAFKNGVKTAYSAVEKPVEGTILTVFRESAEYAFENINENSTFEDFFKLHINKASETLKNTVEMLPQLKEAGVVDSGGAGYVLIIEGMNKALSGEEIAISLDDFSTENSTETVNFDLFTRDSQMKYGYCTEFILRLQTIKVNPDEFEVETIVNYLKEIGGDSIVAYKNDDTVKVHVHTFEPGKVLLFCQKFGEFLTLKIENMTLQHSATTAKVERKKLAVVAVANGDGLIELFKEMGADAVIDGGQTTNPSAGDFLQAFNSVNAEEILVLPNNSNVYLAAKQAEEMYKDAKVMVLHTKTLQEGYTALSLINSEMSIDEQLDDVLDALKYVLSIETTYAIRNATLNGISVNKGEFMAISNGKILATGEDIVTATINALRNVEDIEDKEILTVFIGEDVSDEQKEEFASLVEDEFANLEYVEYIGNQKIYGFLLSVE